MVSQLQDVAGRIANKSRYLCDGRHKNAKKSAQMDPLLGGGQMDAPREARLSASLKQFIAIFSIISCLA